MEILKHIPWLPPGILNTIHADDVAGREYLALAMCDEVTERYYTKVAYYCTTGATESLRSRCSAKTVEFIDQKNPDIDVIIRKAEGRVRRHFVRLVVIDCLESLRVKGFRGTRHEEERAIAERLKSLAQRQGIPVVVMSCSPAGPFSQEINTFEGSILQQMAEGDED